MHSKEQRELSKEQQEFLKTTVVTGSTYIPAGQIDYKEAREIARRIPGCSVSQQKFYDAGKEQDVIAINGSNEEKESFIKQTLSTRNKLLVYSIIMKTLFMTTLITQIPGANAQEVAPLSSSPLNQNKSLFHIGMLLATTAFTICAFTIGKALLKSAEVSNKQQVSSWKDKVITYTTQNALTI